MLYNKTGIHTKHIVSLLFFTSSSGLLFSADELFSSLQQTSSRWGAFSDRMSDVSDAISGGFKKASKGFTGYLSKSKMKWNSLKPKTKLGIKLGAIAAGTVGIGATTLYFYNKWSRHRARVENAGICADILGELSHRPQEGNAKNVDTDNQLAEIYAHLAGLQTSNIDEYLARTLGSVRDHVQDGRLDDALTLMHTLRRTLREEYHLQNSDIQPGGFLVSSEELQEKGSSSSSSTAPSEGRPAQISARTILELQGIEIQLDRVNTIRKLEARRLFERQQSERIEAAERERQTEAERQRLEQATEEQIHTEEFARLQQEIDEQARRNEAAECARLEAEASARAEAEAEARQAEIARLQQEAEAAAARERLEAEEVARLARESEETARLQQEIDEQARRNEAAESTRLEAEAREHLEAEEQARQAEIERLQETEAAAELERQAEALRAREADEAAECERLVEPADQVPANVINEFEVLPDQTGSAPAPSSSSSAATSEVSSSTSSSTSENAPETSSLATTSEEVSADTSVSQNAETSVASPEGENPLTVSYVGQVPEEVQARIRARINKIQRIHQESGSVLDDLMEKIIRRDVLSNQTIVDLSSLAATSEEVFADTDVTREEDPARINRARINKQMRKIRLEMGSVFDRLIGQRIEIQPDEIASVSSSSDVSQSGASPEGENPLTASYVAPAQSSTDAAPEEALARVREEHGNEIADLLNAAMEHRDGALSLSNLPNNNIHAELNEPASSDDLRDSVMGIHPELEASASSDEPASSLAQVNSVASSSVTEPQHDSMTHDDQVADGMSSEA